MKRTVLNTYWNQNVSLKYKICSVRGAEENILGVDCKMSMNVVLNMIHNNWIKCGCSFVLQTFL